MWWGTSVCVSVSGICPWSAGSLRFCRSWWVLSVGWKVITPGTSSSLFSPLTPSCPSPCCGPLLLGQSPPSWTWFWTSSVTMATSPSWERWAFVPLLPVLVTCPLILLTFTRPGFVQGPAVPGHESRRALHPLPVRQNSKTVLLGDQKMYRGASQAGEREPKTSMKVRISWWKFLHTSTSVSVF